MNFLRHRFCALLALGLVLSACASDQVEEVAQEPVTELTEASSGSQERRFANIRQLTFGGENAEAYFSSDGSELVFQTTREGVPCDQIYRMDLDGENMELVSTCLLYTSPSPRD